MSAQRGGGFAAVTAAWGRTRKDLGLPIFTRSSRSSNPDGSSHQDPSGQERSGQERSDQERSDQERSDQDPSSQDPTEGANDLTGTDASPTATPTRRPLRKH